MTTDRDRRVQTRPHGSAEGRSSKLIASLGSDGQAYMLELEERIDALSGYGGLILAAHEQVLELLRSKFALVAGGRASAAGTVPTADQAADGAAQRLLLDEMGRVWTHSASPPPTKTTGSFTFAAAPSAAAGVYSSAVDVSLFRTLGIYLEWTPEAAKGGELIVKVEAAPLASPSVLWHVVPMRSDFTQPATVGAVSAGVTDPGEITLAQSETANLDVESFILPRLGQVTAGHLYTRYLPVDVEAMMQLRLNAFDNGATPGGGTLVARWVGVS